MAPHQPVPDPPTRQVLTHHPLPPRPQLDPALAAALAQGEPLTSLTPAGVAAARTGDGQGRPTLGSLRAVPGLAADEVVVDGPGGDVVVLVLRPAEPAPGAADHLGASSRPPGDVADASTIAASPLRGPSGPADPRAGILHVHGGGMVVGTRFWDLDEPVSWVLQRGAVVVSPEYRRAPEHPHPAPVEDCWAALGWLVEHAAELGVDPGRVVVAGVSAGGGIAAGLALMARDRGGPALAGSLLRCPMLDDRSITPSSTMLDRSCGLPWDTASNDTGWDALLGDARGGPAVSPCAAPAREEDLSGLAPTYVDVGSVDVLRDEDVEHALRIWRAGGDAELHVWPGAFHAFESFTPGSALARRAVAARSQWLDRVLGTAGGWGGPGVTVGSSVSGGPAGDVA